MRAGGATAVLIGVEGDAAGVFAIADQVKATTTDALAALRADGIEVVMLTGANRVTAQAIGRRLGIDRVEADVMPEDMSAIFNQLRASGRVVASAGDGVNDVPALAAADIGLAMSTGTDVAIESAAVTLLRGDLAGIPIAAGVLYAPYRLLLSPIISAAAMALCWVSVISNALRLRTRPI